VKIFLIDDNRQRLQELETLLHDRPAVATLWVEKAIYMRPPAGLDAVFLSLPAAEKWGPDFRSRQMQILTTREKDRLEGFPPFIITGVNLGPDDPKDPASQVRIVLTESASAVKEFNTKIRDGIKNVGFFVSTLRGATIAQLNEILHELF
jgi:hypothetical protein